MAEAPPCVLLDGIEKTYPNGTQAVHGIDLRVADGEFFSLLGPSGCGKTTTLRMIAGFETPSAGRIAVRGRDMAGVAVHRRGIGMVFQNYALFPHRTVAQNVAFGLRMRGVRSAEIARRVQAALDMVELGALGARLPAQLSGGQQQRVALARAIVIEPALLLCDEPLGALDKSLRETMQFELKLLQKRLGVTLIYVTHDQQEALTMSDRVAVMNRGRVEQVGRPDALYDRPRTRFVAEFLGSANIVGRGAVRPEKVRVLRPGVDRPVRVSGTVESANFQGQSVLYRVLADGTRLLALEPNDGQAAMLAPGAPVTLGWNPSDIVELQG